MKLYKSLFEERLDFEGNVATFGAATAPGLLSVAGRPTFGTLAMLAVPGRMLTAVLGRLAGIGRLPYAGRALATERLEPIPAAERLMDVTAGRDKDGTVAGPLPYPPR